MSIQKIEIKEAIWDRTTNKEGKSVHKMTGYEMITHTREDYKGNFERMILGEISADVIQEYAEDCLGMIDEDECECDETNLSDFNERYLIYELENRGYKVIKCQTIADSLKLEKVKELMEL